MLQLLLSVRGRGAYARISWQLLLPPRTSRLLLCAMASSTLPLLLLPLELVLLPA
jgi:hypothetical protein